MSDQPSTPPGDPPPHGQRSAEELPSPLSGSGGLAGALDGVEPAVFLDYDGTLTPIVARPEDARLPTGMREALEELAGLCTVAVVSGRDLDDVRRRVGIPELHYAGSHGFDITGPGGLRLEHEGGRAAEAALDSAERALADALGGVPGCAVERKRFAIAVHYRNVAGSDVAGVEEAVIRVGEEHPGLRLSGGKKVFELKPAIDWHKGRAVAWLLEALGLEDTGVLPVYVGDDVTDEDAFRTLAGRGASVVVGSPDYPTWADYRLADSEAVERFLGELVALLKRRAPP